MRYVSAKWTPSQAGIDYFSGRRRFDRWCLWGEFWGCSGTSASAALWFISKAHETVTVLHRMWLVFLPLSWLLPELCFNFYCLKIEK